MAWPTRSQVLAAIKQATIVANTRYWSANVPSGEIWLVKDVALYNDVSTTRQFFLVVERGGVEYIVGTTAITSFGVLNTRQMSLVLGPGDRYGVFCTAGTAGFTWHVSGAKL
jgi:hypothetical protein